MRLARLLVSVAAAVLATGVASATAQAKDPALDKLVADWSAAFGRVDAKALASFYTDNAIRVSPDGGTVLGRPAIEKEFAGYFAGPWKGATIKILVRLRSAARPRHRAPGRAGRRDGAGPGRDREGVRRPLRWALEGCHDQDPRRFRSAARPRIPRSATR